MVAGDGGEKGAFVLGQAGRTAFGAEYGVAEEHPRFHGRIVLGPCLAGLVKAALGKGAITSEDAAFDDRCLAGREEEDRGCGEKRAGRLGERAQRKNRGGQEGETWRARGGMEGENECQALFAMASAEVGAAVVTRSPTRGMRTWKVLP